MVRSGFDTRVVNFRYPIFLDLTGKKCLVTGEGFEVAGKVQALVDAAATVIYVNPRAEDRIASLAAEERIFWVQREFVPEDLTDCFLVISSLRDNSKVFELAEAQRILCNSVDDPRHCRFSFGSVHRQGDLTATISTNGLAPALAVRLRERLQREVGSEYGKFLEIVKELRPEITARIRDFETRRKLWYRIVDSEVLGRLRESSIEEGKAMIRKMIEEAVSSTSHSDTCSDGAGQ